MSNPNQINCSFDELTLENKVTLYEAYQRLHFEDTKVMECFREMYPSERVLHEAIIGDAMLLRRLIPSFTKEEMSLFRRIIRNYLSSVNDIICYCQPLDPWMRAYLEVEHFFLSLKDGLTYEEHVHFMNPYQREILDHSYTTTMLDGKGLRVRKLIEKDYPTPESLAALINLSKRKIMRITNLTHVGKTVSSLHEIVESVKKLIDELLPLSEEELYLRHLRCFYPFLTQRESKDIYRYKSSVGHKPMFLLLKKKILSSDRLNNKVYALSHGLQDGKRFSRKEIAKFFHLTYSRIQQIVSEGLTLQDKYLLNDSDWNAYRNLFELPFLTEYTNVVRRIISDEMLETDFEGLAYLLILIRGYRLMEYLEDKVFLLKGDLLLNIDLPLALERIGKDYRSRHAEDRVIPIDKYIGSVSKEERSLFCQLLGELMPYSEGVTVIGDSKIRFEANSVDVAKEFQLILERHGKPMGIKEILTAYHAAYPNQPITQYKATRLLKENPEFSSLRMRSAYGLTSWTNVYYGSIRDLTYELLKKAGEPLHIDHILEEVTKYFPNTNKHSLENSLNLDREKFIAEGASKTERRGYWKLK